MPKISSGITVSSVPITMTEITPTAPLTISASAKEESIQVAAAIEAISNPVRPSLESVKQRPGRGSLSSSLSKKITGAQKPSDKTANGNNFRPTIKSTVFDNFWAEKQEVAFLNWLNFAFSGESSSAAAAESTECIESLSQKRLKARQRQAVIDMYNSDEFTETVDAIMKEVFERRLQIREDRDINSDVGLREHFVHLLQCYEHDWLKTCLEVVCGESIHAYYVDKMQKKADLISSSSCNDSQLDADGSILSVAKPRIPMPAISTKASWKTQVKTFILDKMIDDAIVRQRYNNLTSYTQEKQLKDELSQYTICKFLSLVILLDKGREKELLSSPVLFCRGAEFKSSREILIEFCKSFLKGEGDIIRHLGLLGFEVKYAQTFLDEFNYTVTNLATDLRDGVRLSRVAEIVTNSSDRSLRNILRVPAISRLQKLHNVQQTLRYLNCSGNTGTEQSTTFDISADAKAIVDGHREGTLLVLWKLCYGYEISSGIDPETVIREAIRIEFLKGIEYVESPLYVSVDAADPIMRLFQSMARWCQAVLHPRPVSVDNFTFSFTDNHILCYLISQYRPDLLEERLIAFPEKDFKQVEQSKMNSFSKKDSLKMERDNFALLSKACHAIGGVPMLLQACDSKNIPEEKTMLYFITVLYKRLIESKMETDSSIKIQRCFRRFIYAKTLYAGQKGRKSEVKRRKSKTVVTRPSVLSIRSRKSTTGVSIGTSEITVNVSSRTSAATKIKSWMTKMHRRAMEPVEEEEDGLMLSEPVVEDVLAMLSEDNESLQLKEAELQLLRQELDLTKRLEAERVQEEARLKEQEAAEKLVAEEARAMNERMVADRLAEAARMAEEVLQLKLREEHEREELEKQRIREELEAERQAKAELEKQRQLEIDQLKALYEKEMVQRRAVEAAVVAAQSEKQQLSEEHLRDVQEQERKAYEALETARLDRENAEKTLSEGAMAALSEERNARLALERELQEMREEKEKARQQILELEAIKSESENKAKLKLLKNASATRIQSLVRGTIYYHKFTAMRLSAIFLQSIFRARPFKMEFKKIISAAVCIQKVFRSFVQKRKFDHRRLVSALLIQSLVRAYLCRLQFLQLKASIDSSQQHSARLLQTWWRRCQAIRAERILVISATRIQAVVRKLLVKKYAGVQRNAARVVQRAYRSYVVKLEEEKGFNTRREEAKRRQIASLVIKKFGMFVLNRIRHIRAVATISRWVIAYRPLLRIRILMKGFTRLQAFFRAYKIRCCASKNVKKARMLLKVAEEKSRADPTQRLGHLTSNALRILKKGKMISSIYKACHTLDTATRFSIKCCGAFTTAGATKALLNLIRSCNRSTPHQEILRLSISILLNVVRHHNLAIAVAVDFDGTDVVVDLMQMFRDKDVVFNSSCELLGCMVRASDVIKVIYDLI